MIDMDSIDWLTRESSWVISRRADRVELDIWRLGRRFNTQVLANVPVRIAIDQLVSQARRLIDHFEQKP